MTGYVAGSMAIAARTGKAICLPSGAYVTVINTHGKQVVDTWALSAEDPAECMSMEHTRAALRTVSPRRGDQLVTNRRRTIVSIEEDTTPGIHDTLIAACDRYRYVQLGVEGHHDNCTDNFVTALRELGRRPVHMPCPLNLFMNVPVAPDGRFEFRAPVSEAGQYVTLRIHMNAILVFSACPQDLLPVNGNQMRPTEIHLRVG